METKEIKEILSEIGITEENSIIVYSDSTEGYSELDTYEPIVEAIQKFMNHIECNELNKLMIHLNNNPMFLEFLRTPVVTCIDFLLIENKRLIEDNKRLKEFEDKHISQWGKETT